MVLHEIGATGEVAPLFGGTSRGLAPRSLKEGVRFTDDEDAYLREWGGTRSFREIAAHLGRSRTGVMRRYKSLLTGLDERVEAARRERLARAARPRGRRKCTWTAPEERFLIAWWGIRPDTWIAGQLGRTVDGCELRALRLGVRRRDNHLTLAQVMAVFGIDRRTVLRWLERGWIGGRHSAIKAWNRRVWSFSAPTLTRHVTERAWAFDVAKMQPGHYLTALAREAFERERWLDTAQAAARVFVTQNCFSRWLTLGYGPFVERPIPGGARGVMRLVREADVQGIYDEAIRAADRHFREGAQLRVQRQRERRAA